MESFNPHPSSAAADDGCGDGSRPGPGHALDADGGIGAEAEPEIVGRREVHEHVLQFAGHRDRAHRIGALAVFDPGPGGAEIS